MKQNVMIIVKTIISIANKKLRLSFLIPTLIKVMCTMLYLVDVRNSQHYCIIKRTLESCLIKLSRCESHAFYMSLEIYMNILIY